jgi:serine/threonine-protein kinase
MAQGLGMPLETLLVNNGYLTPKRLRIIYEALGRTPPRPGTPAPAPHGSPSIAGYKILGILGKGSMATVYRARQLSVDRIVALKVPKPELASDPKFVERFLREARAAARLNHRNIVTVYDAGKSGGNYYLAMEYVDGASLRSIVRKRGRIEEIDAVRLATKVAHALDYIHSRHIIHRDIKPENILLTAAGVPKVVDLGLAQNLASQESSLSTTGMTVGTPNYISPEQIMGRRDLDIRCDLYALGATLYLMLTGQPPFTGRTSAVVYTRHLRDPLPDPRRLNPRLSEAVTRVLARCLAKDRNARYPTPRHLVADLTALYRALVRARPEGKPKT